MNARQYKILIAEDDRFVSDIYGTKLKQEGYEICRAANGKEALDKMVQEDPDLVLLDVVMPLADGFDVLQKMRKNKALQHISVILLTNLGQQEDVKRGVALGASDYLIKSHFTPSEVVEKIKQVLTAPKKRQAITKGSTGRPA